MSEQIVDVLNELNRKWGDLYVTSQATTATIEQMKAQMEAMTAHATKMLNLATVCGYIGFALAIAAAVLLIARRYR